MIGARVGFFASQLDANVASYLAAVEAADGQALEAAVRTAINSFVVGCKTDGIWASIKASCILMGARTLSGALVPLAGSAPTNFNFVTGDYNRKTGLLGNGSTKYLNSGRANNADGQNDNHNSAYVTTLGANALMGSTAGVSGGNTLSQQASRNRTSTATFTAMAAGLIGMSRSAAGSYTVRTGGVNTTATQTSQAPDSANVLVLAASGNANGTHRIAFYSIGTALTLSLLDSRISTLYSALSAAIP